MFVSETLVVMYNGFAAFICKVPGIFESPHASSRLKFGRLTVDFGAGGAFLTGTKMLRILRCFTRNFQMLLV